MNITSLDDIHSTFNETLKLDVKSLIRLHKKDQSSKGRNGEWLKAIRRSAVVLLAANLENFVETICSETLSEFEKAGVKATKYPQKYRLWLFRGVANNRNLGNVEAKDVIDVSLKLYSEIRELKRTELKLDELKDKFANPTSKNINWIMSLFDKEDYTKDIIIKVNGADTAVDTALGELSTRRNKVAHGDTGQDPKIEDIERLAKFCQLFATRFKRDLTKIASPILKTATG